MSFLPANVKTRRFKKGRYVAEVWSPVSKLVAPQGVDQPLKANKVRLWGLVMEHLVTTNPNRYVRSEKLRYDNVAEIVAKLIMANLFSTKNLIKVLETEGQVSVKRARDAAFRIKLEL